MHALVEDLGETVQRCLEAPYITSLAFRGKWFGDRPVFADMRDGNLVAFVGDQELQRQRNPLVVGRISESKSVSIHMPSEGHVSCAIHIPPLYFQSTVILSHRVNKAVVVPDGCFYSLYIEIDAFSTFSMLC